MNMNAGFLNENLDYLHHIVSDREQESILFHESLVLLQENEFSSLVRCFVF